MEIMIAELKPGANHFQANEDWQSLELAGDVFPEPIRVHSLADLEGRLLTLQHHLETTAHLTCDRCLKQFTQGLDMQERFLFAIDPIMEYDDDVIVVNSDEKYIDLNDNLREMLLLSIPLQKLCKATCRGLCPVCGADLNEEECKCRQDADNSLQAALKQLKRK